MPSSPAQPSSPTPSTPSNLTDIRAAFAASWDTTSNAPPEIEQAPLPAPPGFVVWRIVGGREGNLAWRRSTGASLLSQQVHPLD
jgi:hypothetical protein